ncbi:hypothetical protein Cch01nite_39700 [Cellulomonas chitinilytica]|uniref:Uncharacterized protein n=1 Tax=Cellulomonas chitinilytica TaxID=398759 RepID=A0A919P4D3_9CELL|nr:hypothetical protein [Cellulomonas chitinilytica]GIG23246.1 hypothetical protein Cch01nite_39700 [Cellulomonas chitinilytica]
MAGTPDDAAAGGSVPGGSVPGGAVLDGAVLDEAARDAVPDAVLDDLYGGAADDFVARRDAAARAARDAGDKDLARRIGALRKPTVAAALVNALVRDDPGLADRVVTLGDALREAERTLDGRALRDLTRERRALVTTLVARARSLAAASGQRVGEAVAHEVDQTLTAALADPDIARDVTSGHLAAGREYSGFGGFGLGTADDAGTGRDDTSAAGADDAATRGRSSASGAAGSPRRRVPSGRLTVVDEPADEPADGSTDAGTRSAGSGARGTTTSGGKGKSGGKAKSGAGKTSRAGAADKGTSGASGTRAGMAEPATGTATTGKQSGTVADRRRRAAESARTTAADARDRARKAADRATDRRDERRADLDEATRAARAAHDLHDELVAAVTDLRRRLAKADKDAVRAEDRLAKAERALHDEERAAIGAAQDLRRAERALQAADRDLDALDDEAPT